MIRAKLSELEAVVARLVQGPGGDPHPECSPEGSPLARTERAAARLGARALLETPSSEDFASSLARALRRGPVLVIDPEAGEVIGLEQGEAPPQPWPASWQGREEQKLPPGWELLLEGLPSSRRARAQARQATLAASANLPRCAVVSLVPGTRPAWAEMAARLGLALGLDFFASLTFVAVWSLLGAFAFGAGFSAGLVGAWIFLVALRGVSANAAGWLRTVAFQDLAETWRRRIFDRLLARRGGQLAAGRLTGGLAEIDLIEEQGHQGVLGLLVGLFELLLAAAALSRGAAPAGGLLVLLLALAGLIFFGMRLWVSTENWSLARMKVTSSALARLGRHRQSWVLGTPARERRQEDDEITHYAESSREIDRAVLLNGTLPYRLMLVVGILVLIPSLFSSGSDEKVAITVLGLVLASGAIGRMADAVAALALARSAARRLDELLGPAPEAPAQNLGHLELAPPRPTTRLEGNNFEIHRGEKATLQGSQKTPTPPQGWRLDGLPVGLCDAEAATERRIDTSGLPEGQLIPASLAFNLLAARTWPPGPEDLAKAQKLCQKLDLDPLLEGQGLSQRIGEGGRPLSSGEQARVELARALLKESDFLILDDPLTQLDAPLRKKVANTLENEEAGILIRRPSP